METTTTARPPPRKDRWLIVIGLAIVAMVIAGVIVAGPGDPTAVRLPFRAFSIPSTSMEPTLRLGEYAFANMRAYGGQDPERGDIVVLTLPRDPSTIYVKRGVGLAGEKLQMKNGVLQINGQAVPTESAAPMVWPSLWRKTTKSFCELRPEKSSPTLAPELTAIPPSPEPAFAKRKSSPVTTQRPTHA